MKILAKQFVLAFAFMTRMPIKINFDVDDKEMAGMAMFFPLTGLFVGGVLACIYYAFAVGLKLPTFAAVAVLAANVLVTGALHVDGFIDCADGFFGAHTHAKRLDILKDSHVGAYGVIAVVLLLLGKYALINACCTNNLALYLLAMPVAGKVPMVTLAWLSRYARKQGKGAAVITHIKWFHALVAFALSAGLLFAILGLNGLIAFGALVLLGLLYVAIAKQKLGGATGDVLGSANESGELLYLFLLLIF